MCVRPHFHFGFKTPDSQSAKKEPGLYFEIDPACKCAAPASPRQIILERFHSLLRFWFICHRHNCSILIFYVLSCRCSAAQMRKNILKCRLFHSLFGAAFECQAAQSDHAQITTLKSRTRLLTPKISSLVISGFATGAVHTSIQLDFKKSQ